MKEETLIPKFTTQGLFYSLGFLALVIIALLYFESIFKPLVIAFLIWFIIKQVKDALGKVKWRGKVMPSSLRTVLTFIIILGVVYAVSEIIVRNLEMIINEMPEYMDRFEKTFMQISAFINNPEYTEYLYKWFNNLDIAGMAGSVLNSLTGVVTDSLIIIIYVIFFLVEEASYRIKIDKLYPVKKQHYKRFTENLNNISGAIRAYLSSKTLISLITAAVSYVALVLLDVDYAFLWSFLVFILNFIPYLGPFISSLVPAVFAVIITGNLLYFVYVFAVLEGIQVVLGNFVEPKIMSRSTNLGAVTVLVALAFWGMLWGIVGMFLAVPVTAIMVIILGQIPATRFIAVLLSEKGELPEIPEEA